MPLLNRLSCRALLYGWPDFPKDRYALACSHYGTNIVAVVAPSESNIALGPRFASVAEARRETSCNACLVFEPRCTAAAAVMEAAKAGIEWIVCLAQDLPKRDLADIAHVLERFPAKLLGPGSSGILTPGECMLGIMPSEIFSGGHVGVATRFSTLGYEVVRLLTKCGWGQSAWLDLGEDIYHGFGFEHALRSFHEDKETQAILLVGGLGGDEEFRAAEWVRKYAQKPVVALMVGRYFGDTGSREVLHKIDALRSSGVRVVGQASQVAQLIEHALRCPT